MNRFLSFRLIVGILFVLMMASCEKEYAPPGVTAGPGTPTNPGNNPLLLKLESSVQNSKESTVIDYTYNVQKKIIKISRVDVDDNGKKTTIDYRYIRDVAGKITSIITNDPELNTVGGTGRDSLVIKVNYPTGSFNFDYTTFSFKVGNLQYVDSSIFVYTAGTSRITEIFHSLNSVPVTIFTKSRFVYTNNNITQRKYLTIVQGNEVPALTLNIEYGAKFAPLSVGNEGFLPGMDIDNVSVNDFKKYVMIDHSSNPSTVLATVNYTTLYNSYNLPGSTTVNVEGTNQMIKLKYTYQ
jgi:hypothetical protein